MMSAQKKYNIISVLRKKVPIPHGNCTRSSHKKRVVYKDAATDNIFATMKSKVIRSKIVRSPSVLLRPGGTARLRLPDRVSMLDLSLPEKELEDSINCTEEPLSNETTKMCLGILLDSSAHEGLLNLVYLMRVTTLTFL